MSAPVRALIRRAAEQVLSPPEAWIKEMHDAALGGVRMTAIAEDPVLADGTRRTNLANIMHRRPPTCRARVSASRPT